MACRAGASPGSSASNKEIYWFRVIPKWASVYAPLGESKWDLFLWVNVLSQPMGQRWSGVLLWVVLMKGLIIRYFIVKTHWKKIMQYFLKNNDDL